MNKEALHEMCKTIREDILTMTHEAGSGHPGGSLSAVEIMTALYFTDIFRCDPKNPSWPERDRFILSKGHAAPVLYSVLCRKGFFGEEHLKTLRKLGSILQGHPHRQSTPGLDASSGSLGQGLSIANGMAMGYKKMGIDGRIYCLIGDGELQEGLIWEAAMASAHYKLDNLCVIVDWNGLQIDGRNDDVMTVSPVDEKFKAFGFNVLTIDGHSFEQIFEAFKQARECKGKPTAIIAKTHKGRGVSFMEDQAGWHGKAPDDQQAQQAISELEEAEKQAGGDR